MMWGLHYHYLVVQPELGELGTPHLQGFVQLETKARRTELKKQWPGAHWEPRRGTPEEAAHYCRKPEEGCKCKHCDGLERFDNFIEDGLMSMDPIMELRVCVNVMKEKGLHHVIPRYPVLYVKHAKGLQELDNFWCPKRDFKSTVTVLWGEPDSGKTRYAMEAFPNPYKLATYGGKGQSDFFGEYHPRRDETLVVDDFYSNWKYTTFLQVRPALTSQVCDRYATEVHTKGGFRQLLVRHIVFTSNIPPNEWYPNVLANPKRKNSFFRRIDNIVHFAMGGYSVSKVSLTK